jgi:hypothetical protein
MLKLKDPKSGLIITLESISCDPKKQIYDSDYHKFIPEPLRSFEIIEDTSKKSETTNKVIIPDGGWESVTLDNFTEKMGYNFRISQEQGMRGISRELAFLEFIENKGVQRKSRLIEGLTLSNFKEKTGKRFKRTKLDMERRLTKEQAFTQWLKANGYV